MIRYHRIIKCAVSDTKIYIRSSYSMHYFNTPGSRVHSMLHIEFKVKYVQVYIISNFILFKGHDRRSPVIGRKHERGKGVDGASCFQCRTNYQNNSNI